MRQKLITLDPTCWELAKKKGNFSEWVRNQLRSDRNQQDAGQVIADLEKDCEYWYAEYLTLSKKYFTLIRGEEE